MTSHDPFSNRSTARIESLEESNARRVLSVLPSLKLFSASSRCEDELEELVTDILSNLFHLSHNVGLDPHKIARKSLGHFDVESL